MSAHDFPLAIQASKLDRTTASTYLFAHWSNWLAGKSVIRERVLILLVPNFRQLAGRIADHGPHVSDPQLLLSRAQQRLPELRELSQTYGVKIVLLVPPTQREDHSREIQAMGEQTGLPVWVLSPPGEFPRDLYRDGFHLNDRGSEIFTSRLAEQRYAVGVGSAIELGDAQVALTQAAAQAVQADDKLATARAQLLRALGRR